MVVTPSNSGWKVWHLSVMPVFTFNFVILFRSWSSSIKCYMLRLDRSGLWIAAACCVLYSGEILYLRWDPINFHNIAKMVKNPPPARWVLEKGCQTAYRGKWYVSECTHGLRQTPCCHLSEIIRQPPSQPKLFTNQWSFGSSGAFPLKERTSHNHTLEQELDSALIH